MASKNATKKFYSDNNTTKMFFTVPYINSISESFKNITKKYNFNLAFAITNSLHKYIKKYIQAKIN